MNAAYTPIYGTPDVVEIRQVEEVVLGPDQVRVQVHASPITAGDLRLRSGDFPGMSAVVGRLAMGVFRPRAAVQGTMFAGEVVEVGAEVTRFAVGDDVFGSVGAGGWAERVVVDAAGSIAHRPEGVTADEAAATPYGAGTAIHFLEHLADVQPGEHVLILGGSGGVGRFAIQVATQLGAKVTAVGSPRSFDMMRELGASEVLDYRSQDFTKTGEQYDVIFDIADASSFAHSRPALTSTGRYLTLYISFRVLFQSLVTRLRGGPRAIFDIVMGGRKETEALAEWMANGSVKPVIASHYPLTRVVDAHAAAEACSDGAVMVHPTPRLAEVAA